MMKQYGKIQLQEKTDKNICRMFLFLGNKQ